MVVASVQVEEVASDSLYVPIRLDQSDLLPDSFYYLENHIVIVKKPIPDSKAPFHLATPTVVHEFQQKEKSNEQKQDTGENENPPS